MAEKRLFFALWPDDRQRESLRDTMAPLARQVEGRAVPRGNWHVTLVFIGNQPEERVPELLQVAGSVPMDEVRLRFDKLAFWQRPRIACLQTVSVPASLEQLVASLRRVLEPFAVEPEAGTYRPHITAVRAARSFEPLSLARPLEMTFTDFRLVASESSRDGVQYRPLKQ
ncbi:MAG: RNA 2',3'-cyclic phosphodiesterase [Pseudomonadota bacterium]